MFGTYSFYFFIKFLLNTFHRSVFAVLPKTTPEGYRVIYCKVLDSEPGRYTQTTELKIFDMVCQLCLQQKGTEEGQIIVMDMDGIVLGHVGRLSLMTTKIYLHYLQVCKVFLVKMLHKQFASKSYYKYISFLGSNASKTKRLSCN